MSFISKFFSRAETVALASLDELLEARQVPRDLPGLEPFRQDFPHLDAQEREHWADAMARLHRSGEALPLPWLDAQYELMPELVPAWQAEREDKFFRPFIPGLSQRVRCEGKVVAEAWLTLWEHSEVALLERAQDHLLEASKDKPFQRRADGLYQSAFGDGNDAARLLLPELWKDLFPGQNTFVAVPRRDLILVAPQVLLPKLVEAIGKALDEVGEGHERLQASILHWVDGQLMAASLQDPHPIAQPQRELRQSDLVEAYQAQEKALSPELGTPGPMGLLRTQQGRSMTFTLWTEGQPVLLPEADVVGFVDAKGQPLGLFFRQTLLRITELRGTAVDVWGPRRLRFEGFPNADQLARLEAFATPEQMGQIFKGPVGAPRPSVARPAPGNMAGGGSQGASAFSGSSPVPEHLRGQSLGIQGQD